MPSDPVKPLNMPAKQTSTNLEANKKQEMIESDFYYFESLIEEYAKEIEKPWVARTSMV
jgi:hypothetical protein